MPLRVVCDAHLEIASLIPSWICTVMSPFDRCPWPQHLRWRSVNTLEERIARVCGYKSTGVAEREVAQPHARGRGIITSYTYFDTSHNDIPISVAPA